MAQTWLLRLITSWRNQYGNTLCCGLRWLVLGQCFVLSQSGQGHFGLEFRIEHAPCATP
jgi:hypothetical protein